VLCCLNGCGDDVSHYNGGGAQVDLFNGCQTGIVS
jgi:hypothetical protein